MKGLLGLAKKTLDGKQPASKFALDTASSKSGSTFIKLYFLIQDDILIVKDKSNSVKAMYRFYFAKIDDIGVVA